LSLYTDHLKRDWTVDIDGPLILAVRSECEIDLVRGTAFEAIYDDHLLLGRVLAVLCREQYSSKGLSGDQFRAAVKGDAIDSGRAAVKQALLDFFPSKEREELTLIAAKMEKIREVGIAENKKFLEDPETEQRIAQAMQERQRNALDQALTLLKSATNLPEPAESIPADLPSAS
jgi:hypothetical protein